MPGFELVGSEERQAINEIFDDGGILFRHGWDPLRNNRYRVLEFQEAFARELGAKHCLAVTSGTAAIKVALKGLGIRPGDEVITQSFTFVATVEAIIDTGAVPVVVNIDETLNMDPNELAKAITPRTKAIIPVHMLGVSPYMDAIMEIAKTHNLFVLEDNAESLGAMWGARKLGTIGDMGMFSFDFGKLLTTGEGGMIATDNKDLFEWINEYHDHGHENDLSKSRADERPRIFGTNYRMNEMAAAVGLAQLKKLEYILKRTKENYTRLYNGLSHLSKLVFRTIPEKCTASYDTLIFQLPTRPLAEKFTGRLYAEGLGTKNIPDALFWHFAGMWDHIFKHFGKTKEELWNENEFSYEILSRSIALPAMVNDTNQKIDDNIDKITSIAKDLI